MIVKRTKFFEEMDVLHDAIGKKYSNFEDITYQNGVTKFIFDGSIDKADLIEILKDARGKTLKKIHKYGIL